MKLIVVDQLLERFTNRKRRVELDERVRPEEATVHLLLHQSSDAIVSYREKAADVGAIVPNDVVA